MPRFVNVSLKLAILADHSRGTGRLQKDIAREALMTPETLSRAVNGRKELSKDERKRLAKVLNRTVEELFPQDAPPELPAPAVLKEMLR
jgi:transcriptional regulator with XRE-family HTH domain